jgi:hypothetical protein
MNKDKYHPPISFRFPPKLWADYKLYCVSSGIKPKLKLEALIRDYLASQERPSYVSRRELKGDRFIRFRQ